MTVNTIGSIAEFDTNGVTTNYPFYFKFLANEDLVVTYVNPLGVSSILNLGTHYTANGAGNDQGGSIVTTSALAGPGQLVVARDMEAYQQTSLRNQGKFLAETHEDVFDKLTMLVQQAFATLGRALTRPFGRDYFFAENRRITSVRDPVEPQDATTKHSVEMYVGGLIQAGQGPINSAANVLYVAPNGLTRKVQDLSSKTDANLGAQLIGFKGRTVGDRLNDFVSSLDYATGDGVTDDTTAFIVAMAFADTRGVPLYVVPTPNGYVLGPVDVPCSLIGERSKIIRKAGTTGTWLNVVDNGVKIKGLDPDGGWFAERFIEVDGHSDVEITDNRPTRIGEYFVHFNGADRLRVERNTYKAGTNGISNVMPSGSLTAAISRDVKIRENNISDLDGSGIQLAGKQLVGDSNYFKTNELAVVADISGNILKNITGHGIIAQGRSIKVHGNETDNCGSGPGLQSIVAQATNVSVNGNIVSGGKGVGIDMGWCTNASANGNTLIGCGEVGIELQSCTNLTCTGNNIKDCGRLNPGSGSAGITIAQGYFGPSIINYAVTVTGNTVTNSGIAGKYGISVQANVKNLIISSNHLASSGTLGPMFVDPTAKALSFGNITSNNEEDLFITYGNTPKLVSRNATGNGDLWLAPEGSGKLRLDKNFGTAATPGNFSAQSIIEIKDLSGNTFYMPARTSPW
ncbi:right-handed parallel beta-helix repeat-containing protein [Pseudomonas yamanorum]|nr:right-handed parallel beta-helix repeat-containing protein [Pseudomonas yamanorum]QLG95274.1 right-handed parallel beta-helix repeat-containing protein [Pseudomonas yamanorum]